MYECDDLWGGEESLDFRDDEIKYFGAFLSCFRAIFDLALLSIAAVFLLQHDEHQHILATTLAKCIVAISTFSLVLNFIEIFAWANPLEKPPLPVLLHFLLASARFSIIIVGMVPRNMLKHIWVQFRRDDRGGVIIALTAVLWVLDVLYCLFGIGILWQFLVFPCWLPWKLFVDMPFHSLRKRAKQNREIGDKVSRYHAKKIDRTNSTGGY